MSILEQSFNMLRKRSYNIVRVGYCSFTNTRAGIPGTYSRPSEYAKCFQFATPDLQRSFFTCPAMNTANSSGSGSDDSNDGNDDGKNKKGNFDQDGYSLDLDEKSKEKLAQFKKVIAKNRYYDKYKAKLVEAQKASPKGFTAYIDSVINAGKKAAGFEKGKLKGPQRKELASIIKLEKLLQIDNEDISFIWAEYHRSTKHLAGTMQSSMYDRIVTHAKAYRGFLLPLPRPHGYEFFFVEFSNDSFYFTPLGMYQKLQENAPVVLSIVHYTELRETKGIVLMRGEYDKDCMNMDDAATLVIQLNLYYGEPNKRRLELLALFNTRPQDFNHNDLLTEFEQLKLDYPHLFPEEKVQA